MPSLPSLILISRSTIYPETQSSMPDLKLSVSDLPMLSCHYIQKGLLFTNSPFSTISLISLLKLGLSRALTHFPPLAGRITTDADGFIYVTCNDSGVEFVHAKATHLFVSEVLSPVHVPDLVKEFFAFDGSVSYEGHFKPIMAVQVTELADGVFIGCTVNHAVTDGTSFWNFFNTFAEMSRGATGISRPPDFLRNFFNDSQAVLRFSNGSPKVTFDANAPLQERIFHFSREAVVKLKSKANAQSRKLVDDHGFSEVAELMEKLKTLSNKNPINTNQTKLQVSSFQSLCAQLWRSITRARKLEPLKNTTFRMAANCRNRLEPKLDPCYFGNAIQSIPTVVPAGEILSRDLNWTANLLSESVAAHGDAAVRRAVENWEENPRCFPLGNFDGAMVTMGSSPRFPMYENNFGWGRPVAVRSGRANKFDGKISAFPGREGDGSVDLEVCLSPETMGELETDTEFMQYVTVSTGISVVWE